jgi:hypothetical protein
MNLNAKFILRMENVKMPTLPIRTSLVPTLPGFTRIASAVAMVFDAFADAQHQARAAHQRYPFAEW